MAKRTARRDRRNEDIGYPGLDRTARGLNRITEQLKDSFIPTMQGIGKMFDQMVEMFQPLIDSLPPGLTIEDLADYEDHNGGIDYRWHNKCGCIRCLATRQLMKDKMPFSQPNANGKSNVKSE